MAASKQGASQDIGEFLRLIHQTVFFYDRNAGRLLHEQQMGTFSHFLIMLAISQHPGLTQQNIAEFLHVTPAAVSRMIDTLVEMGCVKRIADPKSRRAHAISLTAAGKKRFVAMRTLLTDRAVSAMDGIPASDMKATLRTLRRILDALWPDCAEHQARS